jgi:hypothetical protein
VALFARFKIRRSKRTGLMPPKADKQKHPPERETLQVSKSEFTIAKYACQIQAIES